MADIGFANVEVLSAVNTKVLAINNTRVSRGKGYGLMTPIATFEVAVSDILNALDLQPDFKELCEQMKALQEMWDVEEAHGKADDILCEALRQLGYNELVDLYEKVDKWYS